MIVLQFNKQRSKSFVLWLVILLTPGVLRADSAARLTYAILLVADPVVDLTADFAAYRRSRESAVSAALTCVSMSANHLIHWMFPNGGTLPATEPRQRIGRVQP